MKTFNTFDAFAKHIEKVLTTYPAYEEIAGNFLGKTLAKEAKDSIGHLQAKAGEFDAWEELAERTKKDKESLGYVFNAEYNPLLRTGEMRDSITHEFIRTSSFSELKLGSSSQIMVYQELGTEYIPPRSVLGMTMFKSSPVISHVFLSMIASWIENKAFTPRSGSYGSL